MSATTKTSEDPLVQALIDRAWRSDDLRSQKRSITVIVNGLRRERDNLQKMLAPEEVELLTSAARMLEAWQGRAERALRQKERLEKQQKLEREAEDRRRGLERAEKFLRAQGCLDDEAVLNECEMLDDFISDLKGYRAAGLSGLIQRCRKMRETGDWARQGYEKARQDLRLQLGAAVWEWFYSDWRPSRASMTEYEAFKSRKLGEKRLSSLDQLPASSRRREPGF